MNSAAYDAVVEDGQIRLPDNTVLPDRTRVIVIVPAHDEPASSSPRIPSPRLSNPADLNELRKTVVDDSNA